MIVPPDSPRSSWLRTVLERSLPGLAYLATAWGLAAVLEVGLSALIPDTALRNGQLAVGARISLVAYDLVVLAAGVWPIAGLLMIVAILGRPGAPLALRWASSGFRAIAVWLAVLLYGASWLTFWNAGVFLDRQALAFWAPQPVQVFHWVYPPLALGVIGATLIVAGVLGRWAPRWVASRHPATQRRLVLAAGGTLGACVVVAGLGQLVYGGPRAGGERAAAATPYALIRDAHAGPVTHALADLRRHVWQPGSPMVTARGRFQVLHRPVISMGEYLAGIAPSRINRWNVVMVQVESLRSDQLRVYGGTREVMPTLDALARESRVFTNAYIQASHSDYEDPVPLLSHYPLRSTTAADYPLHPTYPRVLIYDVLKALGYKTAVFSSQNENWGGMINYHRLSSLDRFFNAANFNGPTYTPWADVGFANWVKATKAAGSVDDRYTVDEAIRWIESVAGYPFFIHMNLQSSHVPYVVPDDFPHRFSPKRLDFTIMWGKFPRDKVKVVKDRYADSLFYADSQLGRLFQYIRRLGLWEKTVIVVGGDNGEAFYEHGIASHASWLFNEVMKVPMIIRAPGLKPGLDDRPAMFLDVPPSVFALLGLPPHPSFQGISLFDPHPDPDRSVYMLVQTPLAYQYAIVRSGLKLIFDESQGYFLYDLWMDPGETRNIARLRRDQVKDLSERLAAWYDEQIRYYADVARQAREYPPVIKE